MATALKTITVEAYGRTAKTRTFGHHIGIPYWPILAGGVWYNVFTDQMPRKGQILTLQVTADSYKDKATGEDRVSYWCELAPASAQPASQQFYPPIIPFGKPTPNGQIAQTQAPKPLPIPTPQPMPERAATAQPEAKNELSAAISWNDYVRVVRAAHALAMELEPAPDQGAARAAIVNTASIAFTSKQSVGISAPEVTPDEPLGPDAGNELEAGTWLGEPDEPPPF